MLRASEMLLRGTTPIVSATWVFEHPDGATYSRVVTDDGSGRIIPIWFVDSESIDINSETYLLLEKEFEVLTIVNIGTRNPQSN